MRPPPPPHLHSVWDTSTRQHLLVLAAGWGHKAACIMHFSCLYSYLRPSEVAEANSPSLYWNGGEGRALLGSTAA